MNLIITLVALFGAISSFAFQNIYPAANEFVLAVQASDMGQRSYRDAVIAKAKLAIRDIGLERSSTVVTPIVVDPIYDYGIVTVQTPSFMPAEQAIQALYDSFYVYWVHPNFVYEGDFMEFTNDPMIDRQYHIEQISAYGAMETSWFGSSTVIAVTDDGFDLDHEDATTTYYQNPNEIPGNGIDDDNNGYVDDVLGWDFANKDNDASDGGGNGSHGTHIAGTIAADTNNGVGVAAVAPGIKVMPLKFYGGGSWTSALIMETFAYAINNGASIINTSYNIDGMSQDPVYQEAVDYVYSKGGIMFNSAGNGSSKNPRRSSLEKVLLVASLDSGPMSANKTDKKSSFSNYGYQIDVSAPGGGIYATVPNNRYSNMSGTSMASPIAAAVAALIWTQFPDLNANQVVHKLMTSTTNIDAKNTRYINQLGAGKVNATNAITATHEPLQVNVPQLANPDRVDRIASLSLRFRGVIDQMGTPFALVSAGADDQFNTSDDVNMSISYKEEVFHGTNQLDITFDRLAPGYYYLYMQADQLIDPFGYPIDGDNDGVVGGDYEMIFKVE